MYRFFRYWKRLIRAFACAFHGLWYVVRTEHNFHIHMVSGVGVVIAGLLFKIKDYEWLTLVITIFLVLMAETFNTAIEKLVDLVSPEYNKLAGLVKDIAAGAVLLTAIMAVIIGLIIFLPRLISLV